MRKFNYLRFAGFAILTIASSRPVSAQGSTNFKDFSAQVEQYMKLHRDADASLPPLKKTKDPEELAARERLLAGKIRELRLSAQPGQIFTEQASAAFRKTIRNTFSATAPRETLKAGDPVAGFKIQVNQIYPKGLPLTTVPPSLLMVLPKLPDELAYRILGSNLLLVDTPASLIVDFIPGAIPQPAE